MPAGDEEKTEEPTQHRREEFQEKGQVMRSQDLNAAVIVLSGTVLLKVYGPYLLKDIFMMFKNVYGSLMMWDITPDNMEAYFSEASYYGALALMPFLLGIGLIAVGINIVQVGLVFSFHPITPDINKINPVSGLGRIFSLRAMVHMLMNIGKIVIISIVVYVTLKDQANTMPGIITGSIWQIFEFVSDSFFTMAFRVAISLLILAIFDFLYQYWQHEQELRMTRQEVKEEMKRSEGDPMVKARRRQIQRKLAMQRMMAAVPEADVVVTNPTHYAVAMKYAMDEDHAPMVVAKGKDEIALRIIEIAKENGVYVHADPPLARQLYAKVEVEQYIPPEFYTAVAEVIKFAFDAGKYKKIKA